MKTMVKLFLVASMVATLLFSSACLMSRTVIKFQDHPQKPLTEFETFDLYYYVLMVSGTHQFWMCTDEGDKLVCTHECGGASDLVCPEWTYDAFGTSATNIE